MAGVSADTVRYYERRGLLPAPARGAGGFREYDAAAVDRLRFVKQAQAHGLTLREIRDLVSAQVETGRARCRRVRDLLARKLEEMEERRRELDAFSRTLTAYQAMCDRTLKGHAEADCPVVVRLGAR
jgi:DNA-binding transcriptional MerR regulator